MENNKKILRKLEDKDAPFMLEWMHDMEITSHYKTDFTNLTLNDIKKFINNSFCSENMHFAFVNDEDEYKGTISLKNISLNDRNAEFAIVTRKCAQGTGITVQATHELIWYAFHSLKLNKIYLNVLSNNIHAIHFYQRIGFQKEGIFHKHIFINEKYQDLEWYAILKEEYKESL